MKHFVGLICLLGLSGCMYAGYDYTPLSGENQNSYYSGSTDRRAQMPIRQSTPQPQQPLIVPQYVPVPQPYYVPTAGYQNVPMTNQNPYMQQMARQRMDALSQNYTAHNFNMAQAYGATSAFSNEEETTLDPNIIFLRHPRTGAFVQCKRADYPCVYAYEDRGYIRMQQQMPETAQQTTLPSYNNSIPRW